MYTLNRIIIENKDLYNTHCSQVDFVYKPKNCKLIFSKILVTLLSTKRLNYLEIIYGVKNVLI